MRVGRRFGQVIALGLVAAAFGALGAPHAGTAAVRGDAGPAALAKPAATVTLTIQRLGNGTVKSTPAGINCGPGPTETACSASFTQGSSVTLRATPIIGWTWLYWDGACVGRATPTCVIPQLNASASALVIFAGVDAFQATVSPVWKESVLAGGTMDFSGVASHVAELNVSFTGPTGAIVKSIHVSVPAPGGNFKGTLALPRLRLVPGTYGARLQGTVSNKQVPTQDKPVLLPAPPEGVVSKAFTTTVKTNPNVPNRLSKVLELDFHFVFAALPASGQQITYTLKQGTHQLGPPKVRARSKTITIPVARYVFKNGKKIRRVETGLPKGFYTTILSAGGKPVKRLGFLVT
jgi:hypothetical protein